MVARLQTTRSILKKVAGMNGKTQNREPEPMLRGVVVEG
jgi:hypothetical protein